MLPTATPLGRLLAFAISSLCGFMAVRAAKDRALTAMLVYLDGRLSRLVGRFDRLVVRWQSGTLGAPRPSRAGRARPSTPPPHRLPSGQGWLLRIEQPAAQYAGQFRRVIAAAEESGLLAAAPQAGRLLRPLCRMLGIALPPALQRPRRVRAKPAAAAPAKPSAGPPPRREPPMRPIYPVGFRPSPLTSGRLPG